MTAKKFPLMRTKDWLWLALLSASALGTSVHLVVVGQWPAAIWPPVAVFFWWAFNLAAASLMLAEFRIELLKGQRGPYAEEDPR